MNEIVTYDTNNKGLLTVVKDYQVEALRYIWSLEEGKGASSRDVWVNVNVALMGKKTISRASIINYLNAMVDDDVLDYHEITGKGGHRRIYKKVYDELGTKQFLAKKILSSMAKEWPEATKNAISSIGA